VGVAVRGSTWPADVWHVFDPADAATFAALPWANVDQVRVAFSGDVLVGREDLDITGVFHESYDALPTEEGGFAYDASTHAAQWRLSEPLAADRVTLHLHAAAEFAAASGVRNPHGVPLDGEWSFEPGGATPASLTSGDGLAGGDFAFRFGVLPGDATRDGGVDRRDAALLASGYGRTSQTLAGVADLNRDGASDLVDLALLQRYLGTALPAAPAAAASVAASAVSVRHVDSVFARPDMSAVGLTLALAARRRRTFDEPSTFARPAAWPSRDVSLDAVKPALLRGIRVGRWMPQ
jgi:hypothetical protein